ncbi:MAG: FecR domain-containing protein, partial [Bacteroidota bacterium]
NTTRGTHHFSIFPYWRKIAAVFVFLAATSVLYYSNFLNKDKEPSTQLVANTIIERKTPKGAKLILTLKDGTRVKLNSESSLSFPESFSDEFRQVSLVGEAFFEVAKDSTKPFVITTGDITTTVLGTAFNIKAYPDEKEIKVAVAEGKVRVDASQAPPNTLIASEMVTFNKDQKEIKKSDFDEIVVFGWRENTLYFKDASFNEIKTTLERWYGIDFIVEEGLSIQEEFNGKFVNESLEAVLDALNYTSKFNYRIKGKTVYIH